MTSSVPAGSKPPGSCDSSLLRTKFHLPRSRQNALPRRRLLTRLDEGLNTGHRLLLVSAPAGAGKTTLLSTWLASLQGMQPDCRIAWLSLDDQDNDPGRFWKYVVADLAQACDLTPANISSHEMPQMLVAALLNDLAALPGSILLVLDDYHEISEPAIHEQMAYLIAHQPQQMHVVIATRADPFFPLTRLRARGQLTELRAADLRFTLDEATSFLRDVMRLDVRREDVESLDQRTEGWAVGLQLAGLSLQGRDDVTEFVDSFAGSHHYVLDYLTEEVVGLQPAPVQRFLVQTSFLERMSGELCDAVLSDEGQEDGQPMLDSLARQNLFIAPLDDERRWYRYHHLFADLLGNLLRKEYSPAHVRELHRRASDWFEAQGFLPEAIRHALLSENYEQAAVWIESAAPATVADGRVATLLRWCHGLPDDVLIARPRLRAYLGWGLFLSGQMAQAKDVLTEARDALSELPATPERDVLYGRLMALLAIIGTLHQDMSQTCVAAEEALSYLPDSDLVWRARAVRALGTAYGLDGDTNRLIEMCHEAAILAREGENRFLAADIMAQLASAEFNQGKLRQSARSYQQIIDLSGEGAAFPPAGLGHTGLAEVLLEWNELSAAAEHVEKGIALCQQGGIGHNLVSAYGVQALVKLGLDDRDAGVSALRSAEDMCAAGGDSPFMKLHLVWYQVRFWLMCGDAEMAAQCVRDAAWAEGLPAVLLEAYQVSLARVWLAEGDVNRVHQAYLVVSGPARMAGRMARVIEVSLLDALAYQVERDTVPMMKRLDECLSLAAPERYVRLFLEAGEPAASLLRHVRADAAAMEYASRLLSAFPATDDAQVRPMPGLLEPLSPREREVLALLGEGLTNSQIAGELIVSLNTVKKHTTHIYDKMDVSSRTAAVARARQLGLL